MFIRPKILRDQAQAAYETDLKYNYMRDQQRNLDSREVLPLLPGTTRGTLNPLPPPPAAAGAACRPRAAHAGPLGGLPGDTAAAGQPPGRDRDPGGRHHRQARPGGHHRAPGTPVSTPKPLPPAAPRWRPPPTRACHSPSPSATG